VSVDDKRKLTPRQAQPSLHIACWEGPWEQDHRDRSSVAATLDLLERTGWISFTYRPAASASQVQDEVTAWASTRSPSGVTPLLYIAGHGDHDLIETWTDALVLSDLAVGLEGRLTGRLVHFGSCLSAVSQDGASSALVSFSNTTGAAGSPGYAGSPDWIESAAFESLLFAVLADGWSRWGAAYNYVFRHYGELARLTGFATDRHAARPAGAGLR